MIKFGGIQTIKSTKSKIDKIKYTLYITESQDDLKEAINCEKFDNKNIKIFTKNVENITLDRDHEILVSVIIG